MYRYIRFLHKNFPHLVTDMKNCTHHFSNENLNPYHLEGDVWTHSLLVSKLAELGGSNRIEIAALLHDVGKCYTRIDNSEDKKVRFFGHSGVSFFESIEVLNHVELGLSEKDKRLILEIIGLHSYLPDISSNTKKINEKFKGNKDLLEYLTMFYLCDSNGRFTDNIEDVSKYLTTAVAEDTLKRLSKHQPTNGKNKCNKQLIMLIGLPCSGKSTYAENNFPQKYTIISRDEEVLKEGGASNYNEAWVKVDHKKVDNIFRDKLITSVRNGENIVVDRTNLSNKSRHKILCNVPDSYYKKAIVFCTENSIISERNTKRENKFVPLHVRYDMMKSFIPPLYDKFDEIEYVF